MIYFRVWCEGSRTFSLIWWNSLISVPVPDESLVPELQVTWFGSRIWCVGFCRKVAATLCEFYSFRFRNISVLSGTSPSSLCVDSRICSTSWNTKMCLEFSSLIHNYSRTKTVWSWDFRIYCLDTFTLVGEPTFVPPNPPLQVLDQPFCFWIQMLWF